MNKRKFLKAMAVIPIAPRVLESLTKEPPGVVASAQTITLKTNDSMFVECRPIRKDLVEAAWKYPPETGINYKVLERNGRGEVTDLKLREVSTPKIKDNE